MLRVVLLGAGGLLGREMQAQRPGNVTLFPFTRAALDVRDTRGVETVLRDSRPDWVLNTSGFTHVDDAEARPDEAREVNTRAVGDVARLCRSLNVGLMHFSTDYVFDGSKDDFYTENDVTNPVNAYGASKVAGEELVRASGARHIIVRTQWLYGVGGKSFVSRLWDRAVAAIPTRVVDDEFACCTYNVDLAAIAWQLPERAEGTYHVANRGLVNRFMLAERVYSAAGVPDLVTACRSTEFPMPARRPRNTAMSVEKVEVFLGERLPEWRDALDRYILASKRAAQAAVS